MKKRIILVGAGERGKVWLEMLASHPDWEVVALVDIDPMALEKGAEMVGLGRGCCFQELETALETIPAEAILAATPMAEHYRPVKGALKAERHVLVEKPFIIKMTQAEELVAIAEEQMLQLMVGQQFRYRPAYQSLYRFLSEDRIGRPVTAQVAFYRDRPARPYDVDEPYPVLFIQAIHYLDALRFLFSVEPRAVQAYGLCPPWSPYHNPSLMEITISFEHGIVAHISACHIGKGRQTPYEGIWRVTGERGDLYLEPGPDGCLQVVINCAGKEEVELVPQDVKGEPEHRLLEEFRRAIDGGLPPETSGRDNLKTMALLFAAVESCETEQVVRLDR